MRVFLFITSASITSDIRKLNTKLSNFRRVTLTAYRVVEVWENIWLTGSLTVSPPPNCSTQMRIGAIFVMNS